VRIRTITAQVAFLTLAAASQLRAQRVIDLTADMLDRFLRGADAENVEMGKSGDQLKALDDKIQKFRECKKNWEIATGNTDGKLGMAARLAMRAKCGASDEDGFQKDRQKLAQGPLDAGAKAGGFKTSEYQNLKDRITSYFGGDRSGFSKAGLDLLDSREADLSKALGLTMVHVRTAGSASGGMAHMPGMWTTDYAWAYLGQLFALQYASGASVFEQPYKPGEWTRWSITESSDTSQNQTMERAFLAMQADSSEWWRLKTLSPYEDNGKKMMDTVVIEALYKPTSPYTKELVRVRAKLPGNKDPQELMVPQGMGMINYNGFFGTKPSKESVDGATVGTENLTTPAGSFSAQHVRFGNGGGTLDWWLTPSAPGGWVKFTGSANGGDKKDVYTMQMIAKGSGAKSELGIVIK
jgi:hypothetical protein